MEAGISAIQLLGAVSIGAILGWYVYLINRNRASGMHMSDLVTLITVIGGTAVISLFPLASDLFGAYAVGLGMGFVFCFAVSTARII